MRTLKEWFETHPRPMSRYRFARKAGVTPSYVSRLCKANPPWPGRDLARRIGQITGGWVTPNDLAGYANGESVSEPPLVFKRRKRKAYTRRGQAFDFDL